MTGGLVVLAGIAIAVVTYFVGAALLNWAERRREREETESVTRMVEGERYTAEVIDLWKRGP